MLKIRISYNCENELKAAINLLGPIITSCKVQKGNTGQFKRAYITAESNKDTKN